MDSDKTNVEYFSREDWTGVIGLNTLTKSVSRRARFDGRTRRGKPTHWASRARRATRQHDSVGDGESSTHDRLLRYFVEVTIR